MPIRMTNHIKISSKIRNVLQKDTSGSKLPGPLPSHLEPSRCCPSPPSGEPMIIIPPRIVHKRLGLLGEKKDQASQRERRIRMGPSSTQIQFQLPAYTHSLTRLGRPPSAATFWGPFLQSKTARFSPLFFLLAHHVSDVPQMVTPKCCQAKVRQVAKFICCSSRAKGGTVCPTEADLITFQFARLPPPLPQPMA